MKKRQAAYWKERLNILNQASAEYGQAVYAQIKNAFTAAQRDIQRDIDAWYARFAGNNGVTLVEAKRLLNSRELSELKWDVNQYIKYGKRNALDGKWVKQLENASARFHITRLEALQMRTQQALEKAFGNELDTVDGLIRRTVTNDYYRTAFELQRGFGTGFDIGEISARELDKIVKKPWTADGRTFSDRIWAKKRQMIGDLYNELTRCCIYGRSQKDAIAQLEQYVDKNVKNAKYCARRIVVTEQAYFSSRSQYDALKELNVGEYEIDLPTAGCDICREMNGRHFPMSAYEVGSTAPPFHPNCENGGIIPYFDDSEFEVPEGAKPLSEDVSFEDWERELVKGEGLTNSCRSGIMRVGSGRLEQAKKRDKKIYITDTAIEKVGRVKLSGFTEEQISAMQQRHKALLKIAKEQNNSNEVLLIDDLNFKSEVTLLGGEFNVSPSRNPFAVSVVAHADRQSLVYLHNHPSTNNFSLGDIDTFVCERAIKTITVVTNQGEVYALNKTADYDYTKTRSVLTDILNSFPDGEIEDKEFVLKYLKRCHEGGVEYGKSK